MTTVAAIVCGLGFGDEGKGALTDHLTRTRHASLVVRYNGGPQAAHNVVTDDGRHHTFSQFGAGTLAGARTYLSRFMLVEPFALVREADVLTEKGVASPLSLVNIDPACVVITPYHRIANRLRETRRGASQHGSVGLGVGEARMDELAGVAVRFGDLCNRPSATLAVLEEIAARKRTEFNDDSLCLDPATVLVDMRTALGRYTESLPALWRDKYNQRASESVVFEGAQGVMLDEALGFSPYTSWTNCTFANAEALLREVGIADDRDYQRVGVIRSFATRHGAGPFPTSDERLRHDERHNATHQWMGRFRVGHFDASAFEYAVRHTRPHEIAITHMDCRPSSKVGWYGEIADAPADYEDESRTRWAYQAKLLYEDADDLPAWLQRRFGVLVGMTAHGPSSACYSTCEPVTQLPSYV